MDQTVPVKLAVTGSYPSALIVASSISETQAMRPSVKIRDENCSPPSILILKDY